MSAFGGYSEYYDLLYAEKAYDAEVDFLLQILEQYKVPGKRVLDLGCGTGKHARLLAHKGFTVHGIDLSEDMLKIARSSPAEAGAADITFSQGDLRSFEAPGTFAAAFAGFHVMSYLPSLADVAATLQRVRASLDAGGLLFFDFWNGSGVLSDPPVTRVRTVENERLHLTRIAEPQMDPQACSVAVHYTLQAFEKECRELKVLRETHYMRYFFVPELDYVLSTNGFERLGVCDWGRFGPPDAKSWNGIMIARRSD